MCTKINIMEQKIYSFIDICEELQLKYKQQMCTDDGLRTSVEALSKIFLNTVDIHFDPVTQNIPSIFMLSIPQSNEVKPIIIDIAVLIRSLSHIIREEFEKNRQAIISISMHFGDRTHFKYINFVIRDRSDINDILNIIEMNINALVSHHEKYIRIEITVSY